MAVKAGLYAYCYVASLECSYEKCTKVILPCLLKELGIWLAAATV